MEVLRALWAVCPGGRWRSCVDLVIVEQMREADLDLVKVVLANG